MFLKKRTLILLLLTLIIPFNTFAYSDYIIASGKTVGIKLNTDGIIIAGSYEVNGKNPLEESNLKVGDIITKINNNKIKSINDMINTINDCNCNNVEIQFKRNNKTNTTNLEIYNKNGVLKTGLYIKDSISGIGTLTFIDPNTELFGVLGHEVTNSDTGEIVNITKGDIFNAEITSITRSSDGDPGEKNAILYSKEVKGTVKENTKFGLFGTYTDLIDNSKLYKVAMPNEVKTGGATILTVLEGNKVEEYDIKINSVKETKDNLRNIMFEITDEELLKETNGIVQGMSGSPIIQNNKIVGAVTHVVVSDPHKGYGIFITNMLEEAEN